MRYINLRFTYFTHLLTVRVLVTFVFKLACIGICIMNNDWKSGDRYRIDGHGLREPIDVNFYKAALFKLPYSLV